MTTMEPPAPTLSVVSISARCGVARAGPSSVTDGPAGEPGADARSLPQPGAFTLLARRLLVAAGRGFEPGQAAMTSALPGLALDPARDGLDRRSRPPVPPPPVVGAWPTQAAEASTALWIVRLRSRRSVRLEADATAW
jgi:hypothetical protein